MELQAEEERVTAAHPHRIDKNICDSKTEVNAIMLKTDAMQLVTVRGSDDSIVFSIIATFFSVTTITHEPLHLT